MENKIEKLALKFYTPALVLCLVAALVIIAMLSFGGDKFLVLKIKYSAWEFLPLYILVFYVFFAPTTVPLMDYFLDRKKGVLGLKNAYARVVPRTKLFDAMVVSWIIALLMFDGANKAYENDTTVKVLEQRVCLLNNMLYKRAHSCRI